LIFGIVAYKTPQAWSWNLFSAGGPFFYHLCCREKNRLFPSACLKEPKADAIREFFSDGNQFYASVTDGET